MRDDQEFGRAEVASPRFGIVQVTGATIEEMAVALEPEKQTITIDGVSDEEIIQARRLRFDIETLSRQQSRQLIDTRRLTIPKATWDAAIGARPRVEL